MKEKINRKFPVESNKKILYNNNRVIRNIFYFYVKGVL